MQKFTIVITILSICVIAVITEVLVHGYSFFDSGKIQTSVLTADGKEYPIEDLLFGGQGSQTQTFDFSLISEEDLRDAGLYNYGLQKTDFDGYLFGFIDLREFTDLSVTKLKLIDNSLDISTIVGAIYELDAKEESLSKELIRIIRERATSKDWFTLNETNKYGDSSFFINDDLRIGTAFLVVKLGEKVYAFTYPKVKHENIKKLIEKLHGKETSYSS